MMSSWLKPVAAVVRRPGLWATAIGQIFRLAPNGWWHRAPFLPIPDARYLRFRMETQYGDAMHRPAADDMITFLVWCRGYERSQSRKRPRA